MLTIHFSCFNNKLREMGISTAGSSESCRFSGTGSLLNLSFRACFHESPLNRSSGVGWYNALS